MEGHAAPRPVIFRVPTEHHDQLPAICRHFNLLPVAVAVWDLSWAVALATSHAPQCCLRIGAINNSRELALPRACPCRTLAVEPVQLDDTRGQRIQLDGPHSIRSLTFSTPCSQTPVPRRRGLQVSHHIKRTITE